MGEDLKKAFDEAASLVMLKSPFIGSLLYKVRVIASKFPDVAGVDRFGVVYINPDKFMKLSLRGRAFVVAHEVLHAALRHPARGEKVEAPLVFNLAADAIINEALADDGFPINEAPDPVRASSFSFIAPEDEIKRWSVEKLYRELMRHIERCDGCGGCLKVKVLAGGDRGNKEGKSGGGRKGEGVGKGGGDEGCEGGKGGMGEGDYVVPGSGDGSASGGGGFAVPATGDASEGGGGLAGGDFVAPHDGEVIREGDPKLYDENADENTINDRWRGAVENAQMVAKTAGKEPFGLLREIEAFLKPKLNWRRLLRAAISSGLQKHVSTWKRPSRKHSDFPGYQKYGVRRVHALVDTSGSISEEELRDFLSEVYGAARLSQVVVRAWDAQVYEKIDVKSPSDARKLARKMRGGGGTTISPALKAALRELRSGDVVVVFTDGYLFDEDEAQPLFSAVASRAAKSIVVTTDREVKAPGWTQIHL